MRKHRVGNTLGGAARSQHIIDDGDMNLAILRLARSNVAQAIEEMVEAILLLNLHIAQVALVEWQLAALADRDDILHLGLREQQRRSEQKTSCLGGCHIGGCEILANGVNELLEELFILQKWDDINKYNALLGEILVKFQRVFHTSAFLVDDFNGKMPQPPDAAEHPQFPYKYSEILD